MPIQRKWQASCDYCQSPIGDGDDVIDMSDFGAVYHDECATKVTLTTFIDRIMGDMHKRGGKFTELEGFKRD
jgi:hypothetical protein